MNIAPEYNRWEFSHTPPLKPGRYWVKIVPIKGLEQTEWLADYRPNPISFSDKLVWDLPDGFVVTHWKF